MKRDGKLLEELIYNKYESKSTYITDEYELIKRYKVVKDYYAQDFLSGGKRQIDVAVFVDGYEGRKFIAIECKDHKDKIDVNDVEAFASKLNGIRANKGIMVSSSGFTKGARNKACGTPGMELQFMTLSDLNDYLYCDFNGYISECAVCKSKTSIWTGMNNESHVIYDSFDNVTSKKGKYIKIFYGSCDSCMSLNFLNSKCGSVTKVLDIDQNTCNYYSKKREIECSDKCGLVYLIDDNGSVEYKYENHECQIINSAHVEF